MAKLKLWTLSIFAISVLLVSCGKTIDESQVLVDFLESAESPINVEDIAKYITATDVAAELLTGTPYIIDIRSAADFTDIGHIDGAVQVDAGNVIAHLDAMDVTAYSKLIITCYTGQTAGFVTSLARMAGYDVYSLKWGMSSWNEACAGSLNANSLNTYALDLVTDVTDKAAEVALPVLETGFETAQEILDARIDEVLTAGFGEAAISNTVVMDDPSAYYIVNYWGATDYALGHIDGAIQYTPNVDILSSEALKTLPTDQTIVVYCYTGQTSAFLAAYLQVLGYDAKSLKFGMNGLATTWSADNGLTHWNASTQIIGEDLVTE